MGQFQRRVKKRHDRLWAQETIALYRRLYVMNSIRLMAVDDRNNEVKFHGLSVFRLLTIEELEDLRVRTAVMDINGEPSSG